MESKLTENDEIRILKATVEALIEMYKKEREKNAHANYMGYRKGWNDCEKKIRNFMEKHCERWKDE